MLSVYFSTYNFISYCYCYYYCFCCCCCVCVSKFCLYADC